MSVVFPNCSIPTCKSEAFYMCTCQSPNLYLCQTHRRDHLRDPHRFSAIFKQVSDYDRSIIINCAQDCKKFLSEMSRNVSLSTVSAINEVTKISNKIINNIREAEKFYNDVLKAVSTISKIRCVGDLTRVEKAISYQVGNNNTNAAYWNPPRLELKLKIIDKKPAIQLLEYLDEQCHMPIIAFFKDETKQLWTFNVKTLQASYITISQQDIMEDMPQYAGWCQLPDGTIFYTGGLNGQVSVKSTYLVNCVSNVIEKKANNFTRKDMIGQCAYFNGFVYVFGGGNTSGDLRASEKYSISKDEWTQIRALPIPSVHNSTVQHKEGIIIAGYSVTQVWKYMPEHDNYTVIASPGYVNNHKFLCKASGKVYLFENFRISEYDTEWTVVKTGITVPNAALRSYTVRDGEYVFFLLTNKTIYRFNINTKEVTVVAHPYLLAIHSHFLNTNSIFNYYYIQCLSN